MRRCPLPASHVYLITLGTVGRLRSSMGIITPNIPNDWLVTKFGRSKWPQGKRSDEHHRTFGRIRGAEIHFLRAIWTDPHLETECESTIKKFFTSHKKWILETSGKEILTGGKLRHVKQYQEVFAVPPAELEAVVILFDAWQTQFGGGYEDLVRSNKELCEQLNAAQERSASERRAAEREAEFVAAFNAKKMATHKRELAAREEYHSLLETLYAERIASRNREIAFLKQAAETEKELHKLRMEALNRAV
ncbi:hypothetical protein HDU88_006515 [Geranomyces variabilis]|nr:hypothetical protein HDU88_006515 [Geranomyces variabilis]